MNTGDAPAAVPLEARPSRLRLLAAAVRGGIYFLVFSNVLLRHFVPPDPWKAGLAYFATIGVVVLLELLWVRTTPREYRLHAAAVGTAVVLGAFALAFFAAAADLFGPNSDSDTGEWPMSWG